MILNLVTSPFFQKAPRPMNRWIISYLLLPVLLWAQTSSPADSSHSAFLRPAIYGAATLSAIGGLYAFADEAYYQDNRVSFHWARHWDGSIDWFDNSYRGIDKFGHMFSASLFADNFYFFALHLGYTKKTASTLAFGSAVTILGAMEIWDAHFEHWGFSPGDFLANLTGAAFASLRPNSPFLRSLNYKLSYNFLAAKSPGHSVHDYEHMTFWLTANPNALLALDGISLPEMFSFVNIAVGFGINRALPREQEWYVALDFNWEAIHIKHPFLRHLLKEMNRFHLPAPTIRIAPGFVAYGLFF